MKANDLMIGDWVVKPSGHIRQMCRAEFANGDNWFEDINPIPLTAEILEKNGFWWGLTTEQEDLMSAGLGVPMTARRSWVWEDEDEDGGWEDEDGGKVVLDFPNKAGGGQVWCHTYGKDSYMEWLDSIYVHELQHALRLCGLNELAENFMIEQL